MVTLARGALSRRQIDEGWPHQVTVELPHGEGRFDRFNGMLAWLQEQGFRPKRKTVDDTHTCFCFDAHEEAHAFQVAYAGQLATIGQPDKKLKPWQW
jgi:hypothetical protein